MFTIRGIAGQKAVEAATHGFPTMGDNDKVRWDAGFCFEKGTQIMTGYSFRSIELLTVKDSVYSYNFVNKGLELKPIINTIESNVTNIYSLIVGDETICVTGKHPFWTDDKGWVEVENLRVNDLLFPYSGKKLPLKQIVKKERITVVYNIEVADNNNYFVSQKGILVHNKMISQRK